MLLIPAIDIKNGFCVRLKQGNMNNITIFSKKPEKVVLHWLNQGFNNLHVVDLDGALLGYTKNYLYIYKILKTIKKFCYKNKNRKISIQLGGGIRQIEIIEDYIKNGISKVIIGTAAIKSFNFLREICSKFSNKIIVSLDVKDDLVAIDGWKNFKYINFIDLAKKIIDCGCNCIIYTDIKKDGMMSGVNIKNILLLSKSISKSIIVSGGVYNIEDIEDICNLKCNNIKGIICGRSIYEGTLNLKIAQKVINNYFPL